MAYRITVNGRLETIDAPADMPLLWVLRDLLAMTGTKYGCGEALCRACTVHLDGEPVTSCKVPISAVGDRAVTTIEGLGGSARAALEAAWLEEDVPQCGWCQPGQLMSAAALLTKTPAPTDAQIDAAMSGNLCRCGTYGRIRKAIRRAAKTGSGAQ
jgi:aerobic-type carbon monoxide dehydrogenase small subunit (CoxS/CutS family)